jgi:hypothetical protein
VGRPDGQCDDWKVEDRVRTFRALRVRLSEIEAELHQVETELVAYLERSGVAELAVEDGLLRLVQEEGQVAALVWEPRRAEGRSGPAGG